MRKNSSLFAPLSTRSRRGVVVSVLIPQSDGPGYGSHHRPYYFNVLFFLVFLMVYALGEYCIDKYTCLEVIFLLIWREMAEYGSERCRTSCRKVLDK